MIYIFVICEIVKILVINSLYFIINNHLIINFMKSKYQIYLKYYGLINLVINY